MNQETAEPPTELAGPVPNFTVLLSPTPRGARLARLLATEQLQTWALPLDVAQHIVAELAANAATHGRVPGRNFRRTLYVVGDTLRIEVTDTRGDRLPQIHRTSAEGITRPPNGQRAPCALALLSGPCSPCARSSPDHTTCR
ncbi:ATP-binding protein [Streptomyces sp. NPDC001450]